MSNVLLFVDFNFVTKSFFESEPKSSKKLSLMYFFIFISSDPSIMILIKDFVTISVEKS